jgi:phosphohistidine phosphatase
MLAARAFGAGGRIIPMATKQLFVLRHAKSSWDDPGLDDHERPLAPRGHRAVRALHRHMQSNEIAPALVLCSSARRTRETLEGVKPGGEWLIEPGLYRADAGTLIERLRQVANDIPSVMLIGHNPAVQMLVLRLADGAAEADVDQVRRKFPTGGLATLEFECAWNELGPGRARLSDLVRPKHLSDG